MKKTMLLVVFSFALVATAGAQSSTPSNVREGVRDVRQNVRQNIKDMRQDVRLNVKDVRQNIKQSVQERRAELKTQIQEKRDEFKKTIETKREELKTKIEAQKETLKTRLKAIKDDRKKQIVERVADNMNNLNQRMTDHFSNVLNQIEDVLNHVSSRADKAEANGKNVTAARTAIANAKIAITAARTAVANQAGKAYSPTVTTESTLKNDVGALRKTLYEDLKKVQDVVKAARDAVRQAAVTLAQIPNVDNLFDNMNQIHEAPTSTAASTSSGQAASTGATSTNR